MCKINHILAASVACLCLFSSAVAQDIQRVSRYERAGIDPKSNEASDTFKAKYGFSPSAKVISPSKGTDLVVEVYKHRIKVEEFLQIQAERAPFLFNENALEAYYLLFNNEPVLIGNHAYAFSHNGDSIVINYVMNGAVVSKVIPENDALLTRDGYVLKLRR